MDYDKVKKTFLVKLDKEEDFTLDDLLGSRPYDFGTIQYFEGYLDALVEFRIIKRIYDSDHTHIYYRKNTDSML
jgi:hypothetical protein